MGSKFTLQNSVPAFGDSPGNHLAPTLGRFTTEPM